MSLSRIAALAILLPATAVAIPICGTGPRAECVVDGDTFWSGGIKYRLEDIDAPEEGARAGCPAEAVLADQATAELARLLTASPFTISAAGQDRYGRTLALVIVGGTSVGTILASKGLARPWSGHREEWCR